MPLAVLVLLLFVWPTPAQAQSFSKDNSHIQTRFTAGVPQLDNMGRTRTSYDPNQSFFPLLIWATDLGSYSAYWNTSWCHYQDPNYCHDSLPDLQSAGFNAAGWLNAPQERAHLNEYGFKDFIYVYHYVDEGFKEFGKTDDRRWDRLRSLVREVKDDPSTFGYFLFDELPDHYGTGMNYSDWEQARLEIKAIDPIHPVFPNVYRGTPGGLCASTYFSDVLMIDDYTVYDSSSDISRLAENIDGLANCTANQGKPIIAIFQAYSGGRRPLPTPKQIRAQAYLSVVHGATGLWYFLLHSPWAWLGANSTPWNQPASDTNGISGGINYVVTPSHWAEAKKINSEIMTYKSIIMSPTATDSYNYYKNGKGIIHTLLKNGGKAGIRYLFAVNVNNESATSKIEFPGKTLYRVTSLLDNRQINPNSNSSFIDSFSGYETRIYKLDFNSTPPQPVGITDLLQAIASLNIFSYNQVIANYGR